MFPGDVDRLAAACRRRGRDALGGGCLKVLFAVVGGARTLQDVAGGVGCSVNNVVLHLRRLQALGLVAREPGQGGTLRPTCRFAAERREAP